jgi:small multidrug resistance pump
MSKERVMAHWWALSGAILFEVLATSLLKASAGFTRLAPALGVVVGYAAAFYLLSLALQVIPVGIAYAIWSGVGIALIALIGWVLFGQALGVAAWIGIGLVVAGIVVLCVATGAGAR